MPAPSTRSDLGMPRVAMEALVLTAASRLGTWHSRGEQTAEQTSLVCSWYGIPAGSIPSTGFASRTAAGPLDLSRRAQLGALPGTSKHGSWQCW